MFGFRITHILNTECAKIWKKIRRQKVKAHGQVDVVTYLWSLRRRSTHHHLRSFRKLCWSISIVSPFFAHECNKYYFLSFHISLITFLPYSMLRNLCTWNEERSENGFRIYNNNGIPEIADNKNYVLWKFEDYVIVLMLAVRDKK